MNRPPTPLEWRLPVNLATEPDFTLGGLEVSPSLCRIRLDGTVEAAEPRVLQVLIVLAQRKGRLVSRDELIGRCWGGRAVSEDAIHRCIAKVRRLSELDGRKSFSVETIPRVGYQLVEGGTVATAPHPAPLNVSPVPVRARAPVDWLVFLRRRAWLFAGAGLATVAIAGFTIAFEIRTAALPRLEVTMPTPRAPAQVTQDAAAMPAGAVFKDCVAGCPEMVVVPSGYFAMGSARTQTRGAQDDVPGALDDEGPQHEVLIAHRFAVARYDVTREEYARFAGDTHRPDGPSCHTLLRSGLFIETIGAGWRHPGYPQTLRDPVVCMSWYDAKAYADWLSRKTSKRYRLPTEAEWEYAARGATNSARLDESTPGAPCHALNGGDAAYHAQYSGDRFADLDCRDGFSATSPVGSFPANAYGLFDMQGNVWQWTQDCYHRSYDGAPSDGSAWLTANCLDRVVRGGSWTDDSRGIRFARRGGGEAAERFSSNGFRVVRSL